MGEASHDCLYTCPVSHFMGGDLLSRSVLFQVICATALSGDVW